MTPDDLAKLLRWLYADDAGGGWLPAAARQLRLNERNVRGMLAGNVAIPATIAEVVYVQVAAFTFLHGWQQRVDQLDGLQLGEPSAARLAYWRHELDIA